MARWKVARLSPLDHIPDPIDAHMQSLLDLLEGPEQTTSYTAVTVYWEDAHGASHTLNASRTHDPRKANADDPANPE